MKRIIGMIIVGLLSVTMLFAHGDEKHLMGTVVKVNDSSITIKDMHGKNVDVLTTSTTKFMKDGKTVTAKEIKEGDRVVVHAKQSGNKLEATMVKIGSAMDMNMKDMKGMDMHSDDKKDSTTSPK